MPRTTPGRRRPERPGLPRIYVVWGMTLALLGVLYVLSLGGGGDDDDQPAQANTVATTPMSDAGDETTTPTREPEAAPTEADAAADRERRREARIVELQINPTGEVNVCLEAEGRGRILNGATLQPGTGQFTYRSSEFRLTLGNGNANLTIDGERFEVPEVSDGIGYRLIKRGGEIRRTRLDADERPVCGP